MQLTERSDRTPTIGRFMRYVSFGHGPNACWTWTGMRNAQDYGQLSMPQSDRWRLESAHRVAYALFRGVDPGDLTVDHLCANPSCVNPSHLDLVTREENSRRGSHGKRTRKAVAKRPDPVTCAHGHDWATYGATRSITGFRYCRECNRLRNQRRRNEDCA